MLAPYVAEKLAEVWIYKQLLISVHSLDYLQFM